MEGWIDGVWWVDCEEMDATCIGFRGEMEGW